MDLDDGRPHPPALVLKEGQYIRGLGYVAYGLVEIVEQTEHWTREELAEWGKRRKRLRRKEASDRKKLVDRGRVNGG
jgi:hypothetical protein